MYYILLTENEINGLNIHEMYLEVDEDGAVMRELGFDKENVLIHQYPSNHFKNGVYGLFDLVPFETKDLKSDIDENTFNEIWNKY